MDLWQLENEIYDEGFALLCGVDEAGRGPLAGPVYAAAVILPRGLVIEGLNDSKKLTENKREALFGPICEELNILNATFLAMNRAIEKLSPAPSLALIDGNRNTGIRFRSRTVVKGDGRCADIAAASVLAKVSRDRWMLEMAQRYPQYGFEAHKGYGTAAHYAALREFGPSPIHRLSFLKKMH